MAKREAGPEASKSVTQAQCRREPTAVLQRAKREGGIVVTDARGRARGVLYAPTDRQPFKLVD